MPLENTSATNVQQGDNSGPAVPVPCPVVLVASCHVQVRIVCVTPNRSEQETVQQQ